MIFRSCSLRSFSQMSKYLNAPGRCCRSEKKRKEKHSQSSFDNNNQVLEVNEMSAHSVSKAERIAKGEQ